MTIDVPGNTIEDIEAIALHDATVRAIWTLRKRGFLTDSEALIGMVKLLAAQKAELFQQAVEAESRAIPRGMFICESSAPPSGSS